MTMDLQMLQTEASEEATVVLKVSTELRECMVVSRGPLWEKSDSSLQIRLNQALTSILHNVINNIMTPHPPAPNAHVDT